MCIINLIMNKNLLYAVAGILVLVAVWYFVFNKPSEIIAPESATTEPIMASEEVFIPLLEQNNSGESGKASLSEVDGKVKVTLTTVGAPAGVTQPAHIHVGTCPDVGAVTYPLTSVVDGMSETILDVSLDQLKSELPLGINVHKSVAEASIYVSCGDLVF